jgi:P27 family predicted phage terminase small subunit
MPMTKSRKQKQLAGTFRPDRSRNIHGVPGLRSVPRVPQDLPEGARTHWARVGKLAVSLGTLSEYDIPLLTLLSRTLASIDDLEAAVSRDGAIIESGDVRKAHPALAAADRSRLLAHRLLGELGLTPLSREKLSLDPLRGDEPNEFDQF